VKYTPRTERIVIVCALRLRRTRNCCRSFLAAVHQQIRRRNNKNGDDYTDGQPADDGSSERRVRFAAGAEFERHGKKADHAGAFSALGLAKKVRTSFERAVELDPRSWEARSVLAEFYVEAPTLVGGGKDKAREQADAIQPLNPSMAHRLLAKIAEKDKDMALAEREYRAAITASHSGAFAWFDLANFLFHANRLDEMDQAMRALETSPFDRPESLRDAATVLLRAARDYPLAERLLRRYLSTPVEEAPAFEAHDVLGHVLEREGNRRAAADEYRAALTLAHGYGRAQEDLRRVER